MHNNIYDESEFENKTSLEIFDGLMDKCSGDEELALRELEKFNPSNDGYRSKLDIVKNMLRNMIKDGNRLNEADDTDDTDSAQYSPYNFNSEVVINQLDKAQDYIDNYGINVEYMGKMFKKKDSKTKNNYPEFIIPQFGIHTWFEALDLDNTDFEKLDDDNTYVLKKPLGIYNKVTKGETVDKNKKRIHYYIRKNERVLKLVYRDQEYKIAGYTILNENLEFNNCLVLDETRFFELKYGESLNLNGDSYLKQSYGKDKNKNRSFLYVGYPSVYYKEVKYVSEDGEYRFRTQNTVDSITNNIMPIDDFYELYIYNIENQKVLQKIVKIDQLQNILNNHTNRPMLFLKTNGYTGKKNSNLSTSTIQLKSPEELKKILEIDDDVYKSLFESSSKDSNQSLLNEASDTSNESSFPFVYRLGNKNSSNSDKNLIYGLLNSLNISASVITSPLIQILPPLGSSKEDQIFPYKLNKIFSKEELKFLGGDDRISSKVISKDNFTPELIGYIDYIDDGKKVYNQVCVDKDNNKLGYRRGEDVIDKMNRVIGKITHDPINIYLDDKDKKLKKYQGNSDELPSGVIKRYGIYSTKDYQPEEKQPKMEIEKVDPSDLRFELRNLKTDKMEIIDFDKFKSFVDYQNKMDESDQKYISDELKARYKFEYSDMIPAKSFSAYTRKPLTKKQTDALDFARKNKYLLDGDPASFNNEKNIAECIEHGNGVENGNQMEQRYNYPYARGLNTFGALKSFYGSKGVPIIPMPIGKSLDNTGKKSIVYMICTVNDGFSVSEIGNAAMPGVDVKRQLAKVGGVIASHIGG